MAEEHRSLNPQVLDEVAEPGCRNPRVPRTAPHGEQELQHLHSPWINVKLMCNEQPKQARPGIKPVSRHINGQSELRQWQAAADANSESWRRAREFGWPV